MLIAQRIASLVISLIDRVELARRHQLDAAGAVRRRRRHLPGQDVVERRGQRVDVRERPEADALTVLLQRRIPGRHHRRHAAGLAGRERPRRAEVDQHDLAVAGQHDVVRLEVAVEQARLVDHDQRLADVADVADRLGLGERAALLDELPERLAAQQLHHHVGGVVLLERAVHVHDARVIEAGQDARLVQEPVARAWRTPRPAARRTGGRWCPGASSRTGTAP